MDGLIAKLPGPFFDFLAVSSGECWERSGRVQRVAGIKQEYFHHPDALRVANAIIGLISQCFLNAHPSFNFYGPTEFRNENLNELLNNLKKWVEDLRLCKTETEFQGLLNAYFIEEAQSTIESWSDQWSILRDELSAKVREIYDRGSIAKQERKALLVLGI